MAGLIKRIGIGVLLLLLLGVVVLAVKFTAGHRVVSNKLSELQQAGKPISLEDIAGLNPPTSPAMKTLQDLAAPLRLLDTEVTLAVADTADEAQDEQARLKKFQVFAADNPQLIPLLRDAAQEPFGGSTCDLTSANGLVEQLSEAMSLHGSATRALHYHAKVALQDGRTDEAMLSAMAILNWADHFGREPSLVAYLKHVAVRGSGVELAAQCLYRGDGSAKVRQQLVKTLGDYDRAQAWAWAIDSERAVMLTMQDENFGVAKHMMTYRGTTADLLDTMESYEKLGAKTLGGAGTNNATGGFAAILEPALTAALEATRRVQAQTQATLILAAWQDAGDDQATDLSRLGLPKEITTDPADGSPMKIRLTAAGPVIYGVGQNRVDDGGTVDDASDAGIAP